MGYPHPLSLSRRRAAGALRRALRLTSPITAGATGQGGQKHERLLRPRKVVDDVPGKLQSPIAQRRLPETHAVLVGKRPCDRVAPRIVARDTAASKDRLGRAALGPVAIVVERFLVVDVPADAAGAQGCIGAGIRSADVEPKPHEAFFPI